MSNIWCKLKTKSICVKLIHSFTRLGRVCHLFLIFNSSCVFIFIALIIIPQDALTSDEQTIFSPSDQFPADTVTIPVAITERDSSVYQSNLKWNQNYQSHPVHPYFRDRYRIIQDMRRLVQMFDYRAVQGYESMSELVDICRKLPDYKKTEMIFTALAGGVVNFASEEMSKQLRKRKINFLQWKLEKVILRSNFRYFYLNIYTGVNSKGLVLYIPKFRIQYYRYSSAYYSSKSITFWPLRKFGLNYACWNGHTTITPFISSSIGTMALSYDYDRKIIRSRLDLRKTSSFIIRIVHVKFLDRRHSDHLLSELLICW